MPPRAFTESPLHLARVDAKNRITRHDVPGVAGADGLWSLSVATDSNGVLWLLRQDVPPNVDPRVSILTAFRIPLDDPEGFESFFSRQDPEHEGVALDVDGQGRAILGWNDGISVFVQRFDPMGAALGDPLEAVRDPERPRLRGLDLAADAEGNVVLVWAKPFHRGKADTIFTRPLGAEGSFLGPAVEAVMDPFFSSAEHSVAFTGPGQATVSWTRFVEFVLPPPAPPCAGNIVLFATRFPWAGPRTLMLAEGRFRIQVEWQDPIGGGSGSGRAIPDTEQSGGFWFFEPDNTELRVKVIDGREVNGHFWFFAGALSNVGYRITVTDQRTGISRTYDNPPGQLGSLADTRALADP